MNNKKLGIIVVLGTLYLALGTIFAESQIVIDPITHTISIVTSGSTSTGETAT